MATKMGNHDYTEASYIVFVSHKRGASLLDEVERSGARRVQTARAWPRAAQHQKNKFAKITEHSPPTPSPSCSWHFVLSGTWLLRGHHHRSFQFGLRTVHDRLQPSQLPLRQC